MAPPARTGAAVVVGVAEQAAVVEQEGEEQPAAAALLPVGMVLVQVFTAVTLLLSELALGAGGTRPLVLLVYRNLVGAAAVAPLAFLFERGMMKKMHAVVCGWISINATFGILLATGMYYYGLRDTNAAYSANFLNLIPIVTFIIAVILRAEKLEIASWPGRMKLLGTALCVSGTMVVSLFRGELLHLWPTHLLRLGSHATAAVPPPSSPSSPAGTTISGTLLLCGSCLSYALWFIVQSKLAKVFPSKYWATVLTCLSGSAQALVAGVLTTGDWSEWKLSWDLRLLTAAYSGVFNTGITFVLISWAITRRGPIYPSMFNSLSLIITTFIDSLLLGANVYLGRSRLHRCSLLRQRLTPLPPPPPPRRRPPPPPASTAASSPPASSASGLHCRLHHRRRLRLPTAGLLRLRPPPPPPRRWPLLPPASTVASTTAAAAHDNASPPPSTAASTDCHLHRHYHRLHRHRRLHRFHRPPPTATDDDDTTIVNYFFYNL